MLGPNRARATDDANKEPWLAEPCPCTRAPSMHADIAHLIQTAVAPVFLLTGVAATLGVLTNRLARIVDRARTLEQRLAGHPGSAQHLHADLAVLARRARYINWAISMCAIA